MTRRISKGLIWGLLVVFLLVSTASLLAAPLTPPKVFPGTVLIADRGNNRLIEVNADKQVVWELNFNALYPGLPRGDGADDSFFSPNGKTILVNLEFYNLVAEIDYASKQVIWSYGHAGYSGGAPGYLNRPDDAYPWTNGDVSVADIRNCRILIFNQQRQLVKQLNPTSLCRTRAGYYSKPNGDTPLPNGDLLITLIQGHQVVEARPDGSEAFRLTVPLLYPSDAQKLPDGNLLIADYVRHGRVIEITPGGKVVWDYYFPKDTQRGLKYPSLATALPNGNIMLTDDGNHRVIVIDYQTKQIIWQYGVTGVAGNSPGQLDQPDGFDLHSS